MVSFDKLVCKLDEKSCKRPFLPMCTLSNSNEDNGGGHDNNEYIWLP